MPSAAGTFYEFSDFRLDAENLVLLRGDSIVEATPKSLEILRVLVSYAGRVVSKEELIRQVWADSFVEEANLSHHIFRLRRALCEDEQHKFIETVSKRGYRFVAEVRETPQFSDSKSQLLTPAASSTPPIHGNRNTWILAAIVLLLICGAAGFAWYRSIASIGSREAQSPKPKTQNPMTITRVTNSGKVGDSTISPDGKFIAYTQNYYDGEGTLYVRQTDTNNEIKLLPPDERIFGGTAFSSDSKFIYYVDYDKNDPKGALYRISVLGGVPARLLGDFGSMFTLSPDGTRVCFYRKDTERQQQSLMTAALDGSGETALLVRSYSELLFSGSPAWSPDGKRIAYAVYTEPSPNNFEVKLFAVEIDSGDQKQMTDEIWSEVGKMNWMADGSGLVLAGTRPRIGLQIYFLSYPSGESQRVTGELNGYGNYGIGVTADGSTLVADVWESSAQVWSIPADGNARNAVQLTSGDSDGSTGLASLPDGQIVYSSRTGFDDDLWTLREQDGKREGKPLTSDEFLEGEVAASPDGRFLVFASDRSGNQHLFRIDADGSNLKQLTFGDGSEAKPDISPDGNWIVYASWENIQSRIRKIPADGGTPIQVTDFESQAPAISPDGNFVACTVPGESPAKPARLDVVDIKAGSIVKTFDVLQFDFNYRPARWTPSGDALVYHKTEKSAGNLWKQNLIGGDPQALTNFKSEIIFGFAFSRDGKSLIVSRGKRTVNVVMLKNFKQLS